jgi:hypothetical protein
MSKNIPVDRPWKARIQLVLSGGPCGALEVWERTMQIEGRSETMEDSLLTRRELADRWKVSIETIKRRERARVLRPLRLEGRIIRYRMSDVVRIEQGGDSWAQDA